MENDGASTGILETKLDRAVCNQFSTDCPATAALLQLQQLLNFFCWMERRLIGKEAPRHKNEVCRTAVGIQYVGVLYSSGSQGGRFLLEAESLHNNVGTSKIGTRLRPPRRVNGKRNYSRVVLFFIRSTSYDTNIQTNVFTSSFLVLGGVRRYM